MHEFPKFIVRAFACLVLAAVAPVCAAQQSYPNKPVHVLVGVPPGGSTDAITRMFADWLQSSLGQPTVVENRPGANTAVAADAVARAAPDGYTLLFANVDAFIAMPLLTKTSFDPFKDFAPAGIVAVNRFVLTVAPPLPVNTVQELIAYVKARPGKLNYGSSGNAGSSHLGVEWFKMLTGTDIVHIPYKGAGPALTDAIAGRYEVSLWTPLAAGPHIKAGKLRPLAVTGPTRVSSLPDVPTFAEAGLPAFDHKVVQAVFSPAGTPKPILNTINAEIAKMSASLRIKRRLDEAGAEPLHATPDQFAAMMRSDSVELAKLIKSAQIKMD